MRATFFPLIFFLSALVLFGNCNSAFAKSDLAFASKNDIGYSQIHPAHPLYFLKTIRENLELKFAGTKRVTFIRRLEFATRRLREVKSLIKVGNPELISPTLEKYWYQVNSLPEKDVEDEKLSKMIQDSLVIHLEVLQQIYQKVDKLQSKMVIRSALNRLMGRVDIPNYARFPVCNLFAYEASTSANLNETERIILTERSQKCLESLKLKSHS